MWLKMADFVIGVVNKRINLRILSWPYCIIFVYYNMDVYTENIPCPSYMQTG